jgi:endonuclease YncB( thermonuclease family)
MRCDIAWRLLIFAAVLIGITASTTPAVTAADIIGAATVREDGSLRIRGQTVWLFGIYVPPTSRKCSGFLRPVRCGGRVALALDFKIQGFVYCWKIGENLDASISAICHVRRTSGSGSDDLAAYLLVEGLALALPGAPFEYVALERIAQTQGRGVWGFTVDRIR